MKVLEERNCCDSSKGDLKKCAMKGRVNIYSCIHCGTIWEEERYTDAAGGTDTKLVKITAVGGKII